MGKDNIYLGEDSPLYTSYEQKIQNYAQNNSLFDISITNQLVSEGQKIGFPNPHKYIEAVKTQRACELGEPSIQEDLKRKYQKAINEDKEDEENKYYNILLYINHLDTSDLGEKYRNQKAMLEKKIQDAPRMGRVSLGVKADLERMAYIYNYPKYKLEQNLTFHTTRSRNKAIRYFIIIFVIISVIGGGIAIKANETELVKDAITKFRDTHDSLPIFYTEIEKGKQLKDSLTPAIERLQIGVQNYKREYSRLKNQNFKGDLTQLEQERRSLINAYNSLKKIENVVVSPNPEMNTTSTNSKSVLSIENNKTKEKARTTYDSLSLILKNLDKISKDEAIKYKADFAKADIDNFKREYERNQADGFKGNLEALAEKRKILLESYKQATQATK